MVYLNKFCFPSRITEEEYCNGSEKLKMTCYSDNPYPFGVLSDKNLSELNFDNVTFLYGGNGSGKSTVLNIIAEKLGFIRSSFFNNTPYFEDYLVYCHAETAVGKLPKDSAIITSDDVFDFLLATRTVNGETDRRRNELFQDYKKYKKHKYQLVSLNELDELKKYNDAKRHTKSLFVNERLPVNTVGHSNGESAFDYFAKRIGENALYLLDEPENSLSAKLQEKLTVLISDAARFFGCQFIISTHSPFLLSMKGTKIYNLDTVPTVQCNWTELENILIYRDFFEKHRNEFT